MEIFYDIEFNDSGNSVVNFNDGVRMVLVLKSTLKVVRGSQFQTFQAGDVFIINHRERYQFIEEDDALYISIHLAEAYLRQYINDFNGKMYILNQQTLQGVIYKQIINAIAKIGIVYIRKGKFYRLYLEQQLIDLIFIIVRYLPTHDNATLENDINDERLEFVCQYIEKYFNTPITLSEIAEKVHLSTTYLSKLFTKHMGIGFNHYINHIRTEHCKNDLVHTNASITQIALKNGFSNSTMLLKYFKANTGLTPSQYRTQYQSEDHPTKIKKTTEFENYQRYLYYLSSYIQQTLGTIIQSPDNQKVIDITLENNLSQQLSHYQHVIQIGSFDTLLIQRYRKQLIEVQHDLGLDHVLIKDPILKGYVDRNVIESDEMIPNMHPYMKVDECLNFLYEHQIGLGIEMHPPTLPSQFEKYTKELKCLLEHIYNTVPNRDCFKLVVYLKCNHTQKILNVITLFKQYFEFAHIVLNIDMDNMNALATAKKLLSEASTNIDSIAFNANQNDIINFKSIESKQYDLAKRYIIAQYNTMTRLLGVKDKNIPVVLLNWNTLTGNTHLTNGEYFRAGIIFEQLIDMNHRIHAIGYWLNHELHHQYNANDVISELNGIDLYHQFDGKRPAFFTSMFFKKLFKQVLFKNEDCIVLGCNDQFQIVVWDAEHYNPYYTINEKSDYLLHKEYQLNILNADKGTYKVKHLTLDKNNGALYQVWQQYNTRHGMDEETINYVNRVSYPKLDVSEVDIVDTVSYHLKLQTNAIQIIEFKKYF
ncbi:transcriptional regulator AryK [Staphylococcus nepalensis]|uniref:transcriptional regulator AryK n=1 Tax=Staphylococcus nepalensis TaxID=214473 RepID=UPI0024B84ECB|nr:helix-turn-helix domain-containing protein [Staphylococcus nepalensis]MDR5649252.1 helix-turn-helix domain-containing protein [Staphylococcus nepalensis]